jgi:hypothetical protein
MPSDNSAKLESAIIATLPGDSVPTEQMILEHAQGLRSVAMLAVSDEQFDVTLKRIHARLRISMNVGAVIEDGYKPWLASRRAEIDPFYWSRYQQYLLAQNWSQRVVNSLFEVTDKILDRLGDPVSRDGWPRRGLVIGDVQSGKTANYTGLICKAADAGYRVIILLTGTLESLRRQTQGRLDAGFVGIDSALAIKRVRQRKEIGVGRIDARRVAGVFTSTGQDFRSSSMEMLGFRLDMINEPILLVVKKNKRILENLTKWLVDHNAQGEGKIDSPLLMIDDEADNASVNTSVASTPPAINAAIRNLLKIFPRSSYVGFTATPFANVFIHPDSTDAMFGDDLFPRDFIYALDPPTNYVGAARIFSEDSGLDLIREIDDADAAFPARHKGTHQVTELPPSLLRAAACFLLANAVMDVRGDGPRHRSMLVNVSHYTLVQEQVRQQLFDWLQGVREEIRNYASLSVEEATARPELARLRQLYDREYASADFPWARIQPALAAAALPVEVRSVNQRTGAASLDYDQYRDGGLRVIAVGGNSLSRGLTLEGICASYFWRGTKMYDALLQMGRWFGYRDGYLDLCRLWMSVASEDWYAHISAASEELRQTVKRMQIAHQRPTEFGLKVRDHPDALLITAANKMRHTKQIVKSVSVSGGLIETYRLHSSPQGLDSNLAAMRSFVALLEQQVGAPDVSRFSNPIWRRVPAQLIADFVRQFSGHPALLNYQADSIADFIARAAAPCLLEWDVVIPKGDATRADGSPAESPIGSRAVRQQKRRVEEDRENRSLLISGRQMRVGSRGIESEGLTDDLVQAAKDAFAQAPENAGKTTSDAAYRLERERPLLMLHLIYGEIRVRASADGTESRRPWNDQTPIAAVGMSFPEISGGVSEPKIVYRVNLVEWRNMIGLDVTDDDTDEDDADT